MSAALDFTGQTAVVTGGTRGLGRAITEALLERGAFVHATYRSDERAARAFAESLAGNAERLRLARFDVADYGAVERFWNELDELAPEGVQVLVNNAGLRRDAVLAMMDPADWAHVLDANLTGSFHMSRFAVRNMMRRRYGRIVLVTSPAARHGFEGQANYGASKAGQVGLMRALCKEVASRRITVNCVSPGFVDTELLADLSEELRARYLEQVPLKRFGEAREVAYAVLCLAAREASYITGATLEVAGGL